MKTLSLRKPRTEDAQAIFEAVIETHDELSAWMAWCHPDYALADAAMWIESARIARAENTGYEFCITDDHGQILGICGVNRIDLEHRLANLGYWVRTSAAGTGIATQAARQLIDWVFANTPIHRLEIVVAKENLRSLRVAEKLGAVREGVLRDRLAVGGKFYDAAIYSIIAREN